MIDPPNRKLIRNDFVTRTDTISTIEINETLRKIYRSSQLEQRRIAT